MKYIHRLYHFLGGINFALILIATTALFVISGTFIESMTQSHRFASNYTYGNPIFACLIWGFFANILFSATRRWPFKVKHIPFLTTHLGLLMILSGVLIKHYFGVQGSMTIYEGSATQEIFETGTYAIHVEKPNTPPMRYPLKSHFGRGFSHHIVDGEDGLHLRLLDFRPHSNETLSTWIKGDVATITGLKPMPVFDADINANSNELPISSKVRFNEQMPPWNIYAVRSAHPSDIFEKLYRANAKIHLTNRVDPHTSLGNDIIAISPKTELQNPPHASIDAGFSPLTGLAEPSLEVHSSKTSRIKIPLNGTQALLNTNLSTPYLGSQPLAADVETTPFLAIIEDEQRDIHLIAVNPYGKIWWKRFSGNPETLLSYDNGFGGYSVKAEIPFKTPSGNRNEREIALNNALKRQLKQAIKDNTELSPPLQLWKAASLAVEADFVETLLQFLVHWDSTNSWIYPENIPLPPTLVNVLEKLNWKTSPKAQQACEWICTLFGQLNPSLQTGQNIFTILRQHKWPLVSALEAQKQNTDTLNTEETKDILNLLTQQIHTASESLPASSTSKIDSLEHQAALFSAYLRTYGIHLSTISIHPDSEEEMQKLLSYEKNAPEHTNIEIETQVIPLQTEQPAISKMEELTPLIKLHTRKGQLVQTTSLTYDPFGTGLKWPILNGEYLVRFQPNFTTIPYKVRLRNARQINYPNTSQPYSYESDLIITDLRTGDIQQKTISMNHVHETWDGYRFYLASMTPATEESIKRVQIVVNHDPAKYWLTYPGAIILSCGILLLFFMRPYRQRS